MHIYSVPTNSFQAPDYIIIPTYVVPIMVTCPIPLHQKYGKEESAKMYTRRCWSSSCQLKSEEDFLEP